MAIPNDGYWKARFEQLYEAQLNDTDEFLDHVKDLYMEAITNIEKDIAKWYTRLKVNNDISLREAKKLLKDNELAEFKWSLKQYSKRAKENGISADWSKQLENASAKYYISRLESIKLQIQEHLEYLYGNYLNGMYEAMQDTYQDTYYKTAYELQAGFNMGFEIDKIDTKTLEKVLAKPWAVDEVNFSDRIWKDKTKLINTLQNTLVQSLIRGTPQDKVVKEFAKKMNVSLSQAGRLIATETAYFATISEFDSLNNLDVKQYEILATLDRRTSDICRHLDGKIFNMSDKKIGITAPPFHCWWRTWRHPHTPKLKGSKRAARNDEGKTYYIDGNMKYNDWKEVFVDKTKTLEEWKSKNKDSIIKEKIVQAIKDIGIKCEKVNYPPKPININDFPFDTTHANQERNHNVTTHEAKSFVKNAVFSLTRFNNTYENYYSLEGISYVNIKEKYIRTAYKEKDYDERTKKIMEVLKQYAKKNIMSNNK